MAFLLSKTSCDQMYTTSMPNPGRHPGHLHDRPDAWGRGGADDRGCWGERWDCQLAAEDCALHCRGGRWHNYVQDTRTQRQLRYQSCKQVSELFLKRNELSSLLKDCVSIIVGSVSWGMWTAHSISFLLGWVRSTTLSLKAIFEMFVQKIALSGFAISLEILFMNWGRI